MKRRIVDLFSAALVGGQRHVEYLAELGMPRERIFTGYDVVDNHYFRQKAEEIRSQRSPPPPTSLRQGYGGSRGYGGQEVRKKYGLPENYFLASARFIEKKNLPTLIQAYAEYRRRSRNRQTGTTSRRGTSCFLVMVRCGKLSTLNSQLST